MLIELKKYSELKYTADWVELCATLYREVTKGEIEHLLINNDFETEEIEDYINSVWNELRTRNNRYNGINPMVIDEFSVESNIDWRNYPEYVLMLILSMEGNGWRAQTTGILFERICKEVLEEYIGGRAMVVGFPQKVSVQEICLAIDEEYIQELPPRYKDRKLDVVGWKSIDNRNNKLLILMQCAAGADWRTKTRELSVEVWRDYIRFGCWPTLAFGFVHVIDDELFFETGKEGGIIFDRIRIYRLLTNKAEFSDEELRDEVLNWVGQRLQDLEVA